MLRNQRLYRIEIDAVSLAKYSVARFFRLREVHLATATMPLSPMVPLSSQRVVAAIPKD